MKSITELAKSVGYPMLVFMGTPYVSPELRRLVEAAIEQEREACAKVCEVLLERPSGYQGTWEGYGNFKTQMTGQECAAAIRARSNT